MAPLSTCVISSEWYNSSFWRKANPSIFGLLETNDLENHDEMGEQPTSTNLRSGEKQDHSNKGQDKKGKRAKKPDKGRSEEKEKKDRKGIDARGQLSSNFPPSTGNILESDIHTRVLQDTRGEHTPTRIYSRGNYHKDLLLIDSGASNSVIFNRLFLGPLQKISKHFSRGGNSVHFTQMGQLHKIFDHLPLPKGGYYYNEGAVANLLSLGHITKEFTVIMNTKIDDAIYIFNDEGQYLRFRRVKHNLYGVHLGQGNPTNKCYLFSTVQGQKSLFSDLDCKRAEAVRALQERLGFPSDVDFANAIEYNVLGTCEYNRRDI